MKRILLLALFALVVQPLVAFAELSEDVTKDFATLDGYVIMQINGEYLVDLDARNNLNIGDILTVVKPGKKVLHPVTKEVVGSIDVPIGFLSVSRIHSGYSYARPLEEGTEYGEGAPVKRFEQVPAKVIDDTENAGELRRQIETNLPHFRWLSEQDNEQALLTFTLKDDSVTVTDLQGDSLHKYRRNEDQQLVNAAASPQRPYLTSNKEPKPRLLQEVANTVMGVFDVSNDERFAEMDEAIIRQKQTARQGIWLSPNLEGHPVGLAVGDTDGDGQQEVATILDGTLKISRVVEGQFAEVAEVALSSSLTVLSLDAIDLNKDGRPEYYISALKNYTPASLVIEYDEGVYKATIENVRWFLRSVLLPGQETQNLVGQRIGDETTPFSGSMFHVQRENNTLVEGAPIELPAKLNLFNFVPFQDERGQLAFAYLTNGDYLKVISADDVEFYSSSSYFGGSEESFNTRKEYKDELLSPIHMAARIVMMQDNEILVVQNDGQRMVQRLRKYKKGRVVSLAWNGFTLNEVWRTSAQPGYLADFAVADADNDGKREIVMAVKFQHGGLMDKARSAIVMYELE